MATYNSGDYVKVEFADESTGDERVDSRNGHYERDYVTHWGVIRFRVKRTRGRSFLPRMIGRWERRAPEVAELIRQAFLRGIPTRGVGPVMALVTEEAVSAQTVSKRVKVLGRQVEAFHRAPLDDHWASLILDGVWMKVQRAWGPQRVLLLVAYGVRPNGDRQLLAFQRAKGESQAAWEGFLQNLFGRGLRGTQLQLILTDGWRRCRRFIRVSRISVVGCTRCAISRRRRDHDRVKHDAQKIYQAASLAEARRAFQPFQWNWQGAYPALVRRQERDLPELLHFFQFPRPFWKKLRTPNAIERCFVEVRRRTRPMVVFTNVQSVDRIVFAIFSRFQLELAIPHPGAFYTSSLTTPTTGTATRDTNCGLYSTSLGWLSEIAPDNPDRIWQHPIIGCHPN